MCLAEKEWSMPGSRRSRIGRTTVRDWIVLYQTHGFDGLKPGPRCDASMHDGKRPQVLRAAARRELGKVGNFGWYVRAGREF